MLHIIGKLMNTQQQERFTKVTAALQDACRKSDKSMGLIAQLAGFNSAHEWQQVVDGLVELDGMKIGAVAAALNMDPVELGRVMIADYLPDHLKLYDAIPSDYWDRNVPRRIPNVHQQQQRAGQGARPPATAAVVSVPRPAKTIGFTISFGVPNEKK